VSVAAPLLVAVFAVTEIDSTEAGLSRTVPVTSFPRVFFPTNNQPARTPNASSTVNVVELVTSCDTRQFFDNPRPPTDTDLTCQPFKAPSIRTGVGLVTETPE
jgi:hypothetical protein